MNMPGHDSHLALPGRDDTRAIGTDKNIILALAVPVDVDHIPHRDPLGNTYDYLNTFIDGFDNCIGRKGGRHKNQRCIGASLARGLGHGIEHRNAVCCLPSFSGSDSCDDRSAAAGEFLAILLTLPGMKTTFTACDSLNENTRLLID